LKLKYLYVFHGMYKLVIPLISKKSAFFTPKISKNRDKNIAPQKRIVKNLKKLILCYDLGVDLKAQRNVG
jgi:hypothetical protein